MNTALLTASRARAFTILEVMISIGIFAMIITAIYATWTAILKGSRAAQNAAASVQRSRIAMNALEAAFRTAQYFPANIAHYVFLTETSGELDAVSMVSRMSPDIPGFGVHGGLGVCRITFSVREGDNGSTELVMSHAPMLADTNNTTTEAYSAVLARDVTLFDLQFYDSQTGEYVDEWLNTNTLPRKIVISLATGKKVGGKQTPEDLVVREVTIPSEGVAAAFQRPSPGGMGQGAQGGPGTGGPQGQPPPDGRDPRGGRDGRGGGRQNPIQNQFPRPNR